MLMRALGVVAAVAVPMLFVYAVAPATVLRLAFGPDTVVAADALFVLGCAMTLLAIGYLGVQYSLALGGIGFLPALAAVAVAEVILLGGLGIDSLVTFAGVVLGNPGSRGVVRARDRAGAEAGVRRPSLIEGWLTDGQAARLAAAGARSLDGAVVEIGSFRGKSAVALASTAGSLIAIDPHAGSDRGPQEIEADEVRGDADFEAFHANLAAAGVADRVRHRAQVLLRRPSGRERAAPVAAVRGRRPPLRAGASSRPPRLGPARRARRRDARARRVLVDPASRWRCSSSALGPRAGATSGGPARWPNTSQGRVRPPGSGGVRARTALVPARNVLIKVLVVAGDGAGPSVWGSTRPHPGPTELPRQREHQERDAGDGDPSGRRSGPPSIRGCSRRGSRAG